MTFHCGELTIHWVEVMPSKPVFGWPKIGGGILCLKILDSMVLCFKFFNQNKVKKIYILIINI